MAAKTLNTGLGLAFIMAACLPTLSMAQGAIYGWTEGGRWRSLTLVPGRVADFTPRVGERGALMREGSPDALSSPVFLDEAWRLRALPGGVILILQTSLPEAEREALFRSHGVKPTRRLSDTVWLIEASVGLPSLELANRLQASGAFASAQPNWWMERRLR